MFASTELKRDEFGNAKTIERIKRKSRNTRETPGKY